MGCINRRNTRTMSTNRTLHKAVQGSILACLVFLFVGCETDTRSQHGEYYTDTSVENTPPTIGIPEQCPDGSVVY